MPIGARQLLGVDARLTRVDSNYVPANPVFGLGSATQRLDGTTVKHPGTHWGVKIGYSLAY